LLAGLHAIALHAAGVREILIPATRSEPERYLDAVLESLPIIPYTEQTAYEHARIWAELEVSGKMIGFYDLIQNVPKT
jgi:predicted nucleic acid-binding protein